VASILIEKPARGDFLPILDGGYSLQYSPLMEYREGQGMILFCQMDVTGRTAADPAAETLARQCIQYLDRWKPTPRRSVVCTGEEAGREHLNSCGVASHPYKGNLSVDQVLVVGPGGGEKLVPDAAAIADWLKAGGHLLSLGLDERELKGFLPFPINTKNAEHISTWFEPFGAASPLASVNPADVHNRDPRILPLIFGGATIIGNEVLAHSKDLNVICFQLVPWQYGGSKQANLRKTFRRTSVLLTRLLAGMGASIDTPLVERFHMPIDPAIPAKRWAEGFYLDQPDEWDDPYRFFRW